MIKDESHLCQSPARERRGAGSSQLIIQPSAALPAPARTALLRGRAGMGGAVCSELVELVTAGGSGVVVAGVVLAVLELTNTLSGFILNLIMSETLRMHPRNVCF